MAIPRSKIIIDTDKGKNPMDDKERYKQKLEARLDQVNARIDKMQAQADAASADARVEYQRQIDKLRDKQKEARENLNELVKAQGEAWQEMKSGFEKAWDDLTKAVNKAADRFN